MYVCMILALVKQIWFILHFNICIVKTKCPQNLLLCFNYKGFSSFSFLSHKQVLQKATLVVQSEVDKCVEDVMKEKNINPEKDARYAVFTVFSFIIHLYGEVWRSHAQL